MILCIGKFISGWFLPCTDKEIIPLNRSSSFCIIICLSMIYKVMTNHSVYLSHPVFFSLKVSEFTRMWLFSFYYYYNWSIFKRNLWIYKLVQLTSANTEQLVSQLIYYLYFVKHCLEQNADGEMMEEGSQQQPTKKQRKVNPSMI